jgi:hypothetical protein
MSDKYASEDPLPGGVDKYFETLVTLLDHVGDKTVSYDDLVAFVFQAFPQAKGSTAMSVYLSNVGRMGLWQVKDGQVRLTPEGSNLASQAAVDTEAAKRTVLQIKRDKVLGYDDLFKILHDKPLPLDDIDSRLQDAIDAEWKTRNQVSFRMSWLRSLGFAERNGFEYGLTPAGCAIASEILAANKGHDGKTEPKKPSVPKVPVQPLMQRALDIAERLDKAAVKGLDGADLEQVTAEAFRFLGFDAQVISGAGNPDVVLTAPMGEVGYRVLIDTKSRSNGCIQQNDVNFPALNQQKAKAAADYVMVLGRDFSAGNLETFARAHDVRLLRTEELRQALVAHAEGVVPLDRVEMLFRGGGSTDEAVLSEVMTESEHAAQAMRLSRLVYEAVRTQQDEEGALDANSLFYILGRQYSIQAIQSAVELLQLDLIAALGKTENGSLYTRLTPQMLEDRLTQLKDALSGTPTGNPASP